MNNGKEWITTVMSVVGTALMLAAVFMPEKLDAETQEVIKTSLNEILGGVGALIVVVQGWIAKDPTP